MQKRAWVEVRGIYGGVPEALLDGGRSLSESGVNAVWMGSGSLDAEKIGRLKAAGARVFAEFNTLHVAEYVAAHPDAAPVGADGAVCPPPDGWQGVCPTHPDYRRFRMDAFAAALREHAIDGIWLDYHHSHASWEQAEPNLPDTCFCPRCVAAFEKEAGAAPRRRADGAFDPQDDAWVRWRCALLTDWVREFREIRDRVRQSALLGTFHCPWSDTERGGALTKKLAIDLKAQARHVDVFSIMPYHARFGHAGDTGWISRQTAWLGRHLPGKRIWPIVQLSDWGTPVPLGDVPLALDHGTRHPSSGVMVFAWGGLTGQPEKIEAMARFYRQIAP